MSKGKGRLGLIKGRLQNVEIKVLITALLVIFSLWIFFVVANAVSAGTTQKLDIRIIEYFRNSADNSPAGPTWLPDAMKEITSLGGGTILTIISLVVFFYLRIQKKYHEFYLMLAAVIGGTIISFGLKEMFGRERPDAVFRLVDVASLSFPSGHSMMSAVVYLTLAVLVSRIQKQRKLKIYIIAVAIFLTFIIGMSRVYLGVHYPTDVIGGWTIGIVWAALCWIIVNYTEKRKNAGISDSRVND